MRFIAQAVEYEARRQIEILEGGGTIRQETRLFDARLGETRAMRSKEEAHDYRYFPDPDLLPLELDSALVAQIEKSLPELPDEKKARFMGLGLSAYDASVLVAERELADYYEELAKGVDAKAAANWLNNEILGRLNRDGLSISQAPVSAVANNAIVAMILDKTISGKIAKDLLDIVWSEGGDPRAVVEARGLRQVTDTGAIDAGDRSGDRRKSRQGRRSESQTETRRLVCRSGDEADGRQGKSRGGQRRSQDATQFARRRVIRAKMRKPAKSPSETLKKRLYTECYI